MPTYDYICDACKNQWEEFQPITAAPTKKCPKCKKAKARRQIGPGAGIIFKGSGFYQTDYRSDSYKKSAEADSRSSSSSESKSSESKSSDSKSDSKGSTSDGGKSKWFVRWNSKIDAEKPSLTRRVSKGSPTR